MRTREVPDAVRLTALSHPDGAAWLRDLGERVAHLERSWDITVGAGLGGGTAAYVAEATTADGQAAVLKLAAPELEGKGDFALEVRTLELAGGRGCARLLAHDLASGAALLERLGRPLVDLGLPVDDQLRAIAAALQGLWTPVPEDAGLPSGAEKGAWLAAFIARTWDELDRPCAARTVDVALTFAERRIAAFDPGRAVLAHGDAHQWNTLEDGAGFRLVDPDGLRAERELDLAIPVRELRGPPDRARGRCRLLADLTGCDATAIWEWGLLERVSNGLLCTLQGMQPEGREILRLADGWAAG